MLTKKQVFHLMDLYKTPADYKFNEKELALIKRSEPISSYQIRYALYNKHSSKGNYIAFVIDSAPGGRKSGVENYWTTICTRKLSEIEHLEMCQNYGCHTRRFVVWYYKTIEQLIADDLKYNVITPDEFIQACNKKGYFGAAQTQITFYNE